MLSCKKIVENGSEYLEGDQGSWQRLNYKMHLFMCVSCKRYVKQLKQTIAMIGLSPKQEPSVELEQKLVEEYKQVMKK
ncbi:MAG: zf-HC2 domain-containing protein [Gammaproteobacteria bacterium]|nr:zf-HC2 domain-containing protein [Gammaproteobacteria bacterium]